MKFSQFSIIQNKTVILNHFVSFPNGFCRPENCTLVGLVMLQPFEVRVQDSKLSS
jgi:hypothetical protein